jgi:hypothetical protein
LTFRRIRRVSHQTVRMLETTSRAADRHQGVRDRSGIER